MQESINLYAQSSKLRTLARMLAGNGDTERPEIVFSPIELDGFASLLVAVADEIDGARDRIADAGQ